MLKSYKGFIDTAKGQIELLFSDGQSPERKKDILANLNIPLHYMRMELVSRRSKRPRMGKVYAKALECIEGISKIAKGETFVSDKRGEIEILFRGLSEAISEAEGG